MSAGAVDAARGSTRMFSGGSWSRSWSRAASPAPATTSVRSRGIRPARRSTDSSALEPGPVSGSSCLGFSGVLSGQNRVPAPPARSTAHRISGSQEPRQGGAVLPEVVEHGADIALRSREDREPVGAAGPGEHQRTAREVEHRQSELAPARRLRRACRRTGRASRPGPPRSRARSRCRRARSAGLRRSAATLPAPRRAPRDRAAHRRDRSFMALRIAGGKGEAT